MAKQVTVKLNRDGVRALLQSDAVAAICSSVATDVLARLPDTEGYEISRPYSGKTRVNVSIAAVSPEARKDNLENNTLLKAVGQK